MKLLDLFCGAGGAGEGYRRAGFDVTGVDAAPMPRNPHDFHQGDATTWPLDGYDAVHASPPCHDHSTVTGRNRKAEGPKGTGWMLEHTIRRLQEWGGPFVVENVAAGAFPSDVTLHRYCGSSFGLDLRRHRWFATNMLITAPPCDHGWQTPRFRSLDSRAKSLATVIGVHGHLNYPGEFPLRCAAMGIYWMNNAELSQAIPPAYTEHIGRQLRAALRGDTE